jgi:MtrB/PioB family decaheme-associated outer membrane protein
MLKNKIALLPIAAMLAIIGSEQAVADSAIGVDTVLGNAQNPGGLDTTRSVDTEGFSPVMSGKGPSHTPSGQLYEYPPQAPNVVAGENGWEYTGSVEVGVTGKDGKNKATGLREYTAWDNGATINSFSATAEKPEDATYVKVRGGGIGRDDKYLGVEAGKYNDIRFSAFYNETPHVFATNARPLWNGVGSNNLTLPAPLVAGSQSQTNPASYSLLQSAVAATGETTLALERKKFGVRVDSPLNEQSSAFVSYTNERRQGSRPFGGSFLFDFIRPAVGSTGGVTGAVMETVEPIDYTTHEVLTGLRHVGDKTRSNVTFSASLFHNENKSLTWENPFAIAGSTSYEQGRQALSPDNHAYNLRGEFARVLPLNGQFSATAAVGRMGQNEQLLPPTINDGLNANGTPAAYAAQIARYNTTSVLSQQTANARIDTQLLDLGLSLMPIQDLTVRGKFRYYDEDNKTRYTAIDPLTGKIGYPALDFALPGVFGAGFGFYNAARNNNIHYMNIPTSYTRWNSSLGVDYQLARATMAGVNYEREEYDRPYREVEHTKEDKLKFNLSTRAIEDSTIRASYEYANRRGSEYRTDIFEQFYTASRSDYTGPAAVHTLAEMRKFDLADRRQHVVNARWNYMWRNDIDSFLSIQHKLNDYYDSAYGRTGNEKQDSFNAELNYNPAPGKSLYAYYSYQKGRMQQGNINQGTTGVRASENAGVDNMYPLNGAWTANTGDTNHVIGTGFAYDFGKLRLDSRYSLSLSKTRLNYGYTDITAATIGSGARETLTAAQAGSEFSDMNYRSHSLETSLVYPLNPQTAVRLMHRWEKRSTTDWHYSGLADNLLIDQRLYLGAVPQDYNVQIIGLFIQHRM